MPTRENTVRRMKEIVDNYKQIKQKMRRQSVNASNRKLIQRIRQEALEELGTLIARL